VCYNDQERLPLKVNPESGTNACLALYFNLAAGIVINLLDNIANMKADPRTFHVGVQALEQGKYLLFLARVHAQSVVCHGKAVAFTLRPAGDVNQRSLIRGAVRNGT
jgi:hypothetical protein